MSSGALRVGTQILKRLIRPTVCRSVFILVYSIKTKDRRRDRMRTTVCSLIYSPLLSSFVSEVNILGYPAKVLWSLSSVAILTYQKGCDIHK